MRTQRIIVTNVSAQQVGISNASSQQIGVDNPYTIIVAADRYDGEHAVTPSNVQQILETKGKTMREDIVINPIPKNYGLITYNGFELTVS